MNIFLLVTKNSTRKQTEKKQTQKQMKGSVYLYQTAGQPIPKTILLIQEKNFTIVLFALRKCILTFVIDRRF